MISFQKGFRGEIFGISALQVGASCAESRLHGLAFGALAVAFFSSRNLLIDPNNKRGDLYFLYYSRRLLLYRYLFVSYLDDSGVS